MASPLTDSVVGSEKHPPAPEDPADTPWLRVGPPLPQRSLVRAHGGRGSGVQGWEQRLQLKKESQAKQIHSSFLEFGEGNLEGMCHQQKERNTRVRGGVKASRGEHG